MKGARLRRARAQGRKTLDTSAVGQQSTLQVDNFWSAAIVLSLDDRRRSDFPRSSEATCSIAEAYPAELHGVGGNH